MHLLLHLESILSDFRFMFNSQNFALFQAFIYGFITHTGTGTLTQLYQVRDASVPRQLGRRCSTFEMSIIGNTVTCIKTCVYHQGHVK